MTQSHATSPKEYSEGLEDVVAGTSEICFIDGKEGRLIYRGYDINDLIDHATFEEVVYLLWNGELPNATQLATFSRELTRSKSLPEEVWQVVNLLAPKATPMDTLRTAVSMLKSFDPEGESIEPVTTHRIALRITAAIPVIVAAIGRIRQGHAAVLPRRDLDFAGDFLYMLKGTDPDPLERDVFDAALIMHADHELNASTFAARVTCATLSDMYSAVTSAIGALKGPLHGGANIAAMQMLLEIAEPENVEPFIENALTNHRKVSGFGHRVYKTMDPRADKLRVLSRTLSEHYDNPKWLDMTEQVYHSVHQAKNLWPNVDLFSAPTYYVMGIPLEIYTPIFAMSRVSGWTAHILEQYANNRLIRPTSIYKGPALRQVLPLNQR